MEYKHKLEEIFLKISKNKNITPETSLKDLGIDSLDLVEIVMQIEDELGITFEDEEIENFKIVQDVYDSIEKKLTK